MSFLNKEDYEEACCPLKMDKNPERINTRRVLSALDGYLGKNDYDGAERHLKYWILEADNAGDLHGKLTVLNEQIGLYRKRGKKEECLQVIKEALELADSLELGETISYGTTLVNAATGYKSFRMAEEALPLYRQALVIYERDLPGDDGRLGALYNNMALAICDLGEYRAAEEYYERAMAIMERQEFGALEVAITCLNIADLIEAEQGREQGEERIFALLDRAEALLNGEGLPRNGYYAFVCEKCAPVFGYYGYFLTERELKERAREIYERN